MKQLILAAGIALLAIPAFGQLTVAKNGQSIFGKRVALSSLGQQSVSTADPQIVGGNSGASLAPIPVDSMASAVFLGKEAQNAGGYVTFGSYKHVYVGEMPSTSTRSSMLQLYGGKGFSGNCASGQVFSYQHKNTVGAVGSVPFRFYTDLRANSFIVDSDARIKANVESLEDSEELLSRISPVSYTLTGATLATKLSAVTDGTDDSAPLAPDSRTRYGFVAQEVKEVFPELVVEDEEGLMGIDYIGFIPVLVDAVKSLRAKVESQQEELTALRMQSAPARKVASAGADSSLGILSAESVVYQNRPNPFTDTTVIPYEIPEGVAQADIYIYTLQGQQVMHAAVEERGSGSLTVDAAALSPGMYIYTLMTDGVEAGSKRMIITE